MYVNINTVLIAKNRLKKSTQKKENNYADKLKIKIDKLTDNETFFIKLPTLS